MTVTDLQSRLASLEREVTQIKQQLAKQKAPARRNWFNDIWGMYAGDPAFKEAMRLGRKWRAAQRPKRSRTSMTAK